jgi:hypothetical protein
MCKMINYKANYILAVELQPYGSKNLDGYRRAVVPPIHKTWHFADQNLSLTSTECILHSTHFPCIKHGIYWLNKYLSPTLLSQSPLLTLKVFNVYTFRRFCVRLKPSGFCKHEHWRLLCGWGQLFWLWNMWEGGIHQSQVLKNLWKIIILLGVNVCIS